MRRLLPLILLVITLLAPQQSRAEAPAQYTVPGVSKALAEYRYAHITDVRYRLTFTIPQQGPIHGHATITLHLQAPTDVILDYKATQAPTLTVADAPHTPKACSPEESTNFVRYENEHIIVPAELTIAGENHLDIDFTPDDQSFNRRDDLLYTLFVPDRARTAFPCFDQPDIKARFTLSLQVPEGWEAVSNTAPVTTTASAQATAPAQATVPETSVSVKTITFAQSEPLPTYLFAFAAGRFTYQQHTTASGRTIGAYHRETDPQRIAQLPEIFSQVDHSLRWQEDFTGVAYPFAKYDLVILPGFQFGGMEHTGATFYNDNTIFLSPSPTPDEILSRAALIAHETTHMWFGDYVTMRWFDDVWTKEVFANYFAAEITKPLFPDVNHTLNRLKTYAAAALSEDRTWTTPITLSNGEVIRGGGTSIRQPLDNLRDAGLVYNQIIYNKAPLMMYKLVDIMGHDAFRQSIREYVSTYAYSNATWDDLVRILDRHTPADIQAFSRSWVNEPGMPHINLSLTPHSPKTEGQQIAAPSTLQSSIQGREHEDLERVEGWGSLTVTQTDPYERNLIWPQSFAVTLVTATADTTIVVNIHPQPANTTPLNQLQIPLPAKWADALVIPNTDGQGYGLFLTNKPQTDQLLRLLAAPQTVTAHSPQKGAQQTAASSPQSPTLREWDVLARQATLMNLHENYLIRRFSHDEWALALVSALTHETNPLIASTIVSYLARPILAIGDEARTTYRDTRSTNLINVIDSLENQLRHLATQHPLPSVRTQILRLLMHVGTRKDTIVQLYEEWFRADNPNLSERDLMNLSYELAIRIPTEAENIIDRQRQRITNPDRQHEYDFISRAVIPYRHHAEQVFTDLLTPEGRRIEPWAAAVLRLLNHPLRDTRSTAYILPALEALEDVQRTGDIFFPANWCSALLGEHIRPEARDQVIHFLNQHPDYPPLRRNKIINAAYGLMR